MHRRRFLQSIARRSLPVLAPGVISLSSSARGSEERRRERRGKRGLRANVVIAGAGLGGCAAALAAARNGARVVLTEETDWIGGQLTQQGVPPDEHPWIEQFGAPRSYRDVRARIRRYYRDHYPLTAAARARWNLNPGDGRVSRLCHEPRVALAVLRELLAPYVSRGRVTLLLEHRVLGADVDGDRVRSLEARDEVRGASVVLEAPCFIDATELGDLLPLTGTEFVVGAESHKETSEPHAPEEAAPANQQAFTHCFAVEYLEGEEHIIEKPRDYAFWKTYVPSLRPPWPGRLLDFSYTHPSTLEPRELLFDPVEEERNNRFGLWQYRRIAHKKNFSPGSYRGDISLINWPQNDYLLGNLIGVDEAEKARHIEGGKQLSLSLLYWLQTEAPRGAARGSAKRGGAKQGGARAGFPELRLRRDVLGTADGLAKYPYVREARRLRALLTVLEQHVATDARMQLTGLPQERVTSLPFEDAVGVGAYRLDLHPSTGGDNYIDVSSLPFQIPLGALIPERMENLIAGAKNIGVTHLSGGCYRLHPVEWNIGEAAGTLAALCAKKGEPPRAVREKTAWLRELQDLLRHQGVETQWPQLRPL